MAGGHFRAEYERVLDEAGFLSRYTWSILTQVSQEEYVDGMYSSRNIKVCTDNYSI